MTDYTNLPEFQPWPKIPRLFGNKNIIVTEKVNGTNAAVVIPEDDSGVFAQSRKKIITPGNDNFGFARYVAENEVLLKELLGYGTHFGEWYGEGIQKNELGITGKRFMLFNVTRWRELFESAEEDGEDARSRIHKVRSLSLDVATVLYEGVFDTLAVANVVKNLRERGSQHVPGGKAEGVVVYHEASNQLFKVLCENDDMSKTEAGRS